MKRLFDWNRIAHFFESGDLVPFAVVVSAWHFVFALIAYSGEFWLIAVAMGIFVDMLHFRTVRYAVRDRNRAAILIALVTTVGSYLFHLLFYMNGEAFQPVYLLLATPLPVGIPILAWQQQQAKTEQEQADAEEKQALANENKTLQDSNKALQATIKDLQKSIKDQQAIIKAWQALNIEAQTLARFNAKQITASEAANIIGVKDERTVQSRAEKLNGIKH